MILLGKEMRNFEIVLSGCYRIVILFYGVAIKIPTFLYGWRFFLKVMLCNDYETSLYKSHGKKIKELCPVLFHLPLGLMSVQKRADVLTDDEYMYLKFNDLINNDHYVPVEDKSNSFGRLDGNIVIIDYGRF